MSSSAPTCKAGTSAKAGRKAHRLCRSKTFRSGRVADGSWLLAFKTLLHLVNWQSKNSQGRLLMRPVAPANGSNARCGVVRLPRLADRKAPSTGYRKWLLRPYPPSFADPLQRLVSPNVAHPFGTDEYGNYVLSRPIAAPLTDVLIAVIAITLSVPPGDVAAYFEGADRRAMRWISEVTLRLFNVIQAFPVFILAMVLVAIQMQQGAALPRIFCGFGPCGIAKKVRIGRDARIFHPDPVNLYGCSVAD
jgi:ABC-type dipeptide/oligopeptide/nickel transport system permease subunit